ncbi:MAG: flagellar hook-basal body complex protein FliE [Deltaproteobacteria bacterium]|nr:MAG: flagellar hook-basal body complex protein FliE [Deltaproteobacteria bacterium]
MYINKLSGNLNISGTPLNNKKESLFSGVSFKDRLENAVSQVNSFQHIADDASEAVVRGELGIHEGMMALQEADLSFRFLNQVRSKAISAYQEIMRMQF